MKPAIMTIGVYGFDEQSFFQALQNARVDTLCDIRARRGVRGSDYAFANSERLQKRLTELNIRRVFACCSPAVITIHEIRLSASVRSGTSGCAPYHHQRLHMLKIRLLELIVTCNLPIHQFKNYCSNTSNRGKGASLSSSMAASRATATSVISRAHMACHRAVQATG